MTAASGGTGDAVTVETWGPGMAGGLRLGE